MTGWKEVLEKEVEKEYFKTLADYVKDRRKEVNVYPPVRDMLRALELTPFQEIKVVILGQDPYHGLGQANGLAFSVPLGVNTPPSLENIILEMSQDLNHELVYAKDFSLEHLAEQGVLLLNSVLTVEEGKPGSHAKRGWEIFTDHIIKEISSKKENVVFLLWGNYAKKKASLIDHSKHLVLTAAHPSPLAAHRGFFGCKHFSRTNEFLSEKNLPVVEWLTKTITSIQVLTN